MLYTIHFMGHCEPMPWIAVSYPSLSDRHGVRLEKSHGEFPSR